MRTAGAPRPATTTRSSPTCTTPSRVFRPRSASSAARSLRGAATTRTRRAIRTRPRASYSRLPPEFAHPRTTTISLADYDKLVAALREAFDGTAQPGSALPIVYTEFGVQSRIPDRLRDLYENHGHPAARDAVDRSTQAAYYARAIIAAACQPTVEAILLFLALDEPDLARWLSGVFYVDGSWKPSRMTVRAATRQLDAGDVQCED
jgi:hypothetical protein